MSMVDGCEVIAYCKEEDRRIKFFNLQDEEEFSVSTDSPYARWKHIIPFKWSYCYDCTEQKFIHSSATPI